jgi:2-polyprenyl-3-methyl-5-hydroxy-6-metoxy-1,4-benzoquinol methylase
VSLTRGFARDVGPPFVFSVPDLTTPMLLPDLESDLLSRIPLSARTVLDVGCGIGPLAAIYRTMNPNARLHGIEVDPAAAQSASHLDRIVAMNQPGDPLPFDTPGGIDCIIYNGILEHLADPWALIRRHADLLSLDGIMLICVPNIEYWRVAERLLRGTWHGAGQPPTGASWFDAASVAANLAAAGLTLCDITPRQPDGEAPARFAASLAIGLEALGIDPHDYARRAAPSHLIVRVRRDPCQRMILTGNMLTPVGGVSHVRVVYPIQAIATDPTVSASVTDRVEIGQPGDGMSRIFVLHRPALIGEQGHQVLRGLTDAGFLIVTEFDDLPDHFDMMRMGGELSFTGVHAVQTSTAAMAEALRKYNPEIAVFPNAVGTLPEVTNFADPDATTVFFGALNRQHDWLALMPAINDTRRSSPLWKPRTRRSPPPATTKPTAGSSAVRKSR